LKKPDPYCQLLLAYYDAVAAAEPELEVIY
jgi:hypothetical protein